MGKENITATTNTFSYSCNCNIVDLICGLEQNASIRHIRSTDESSLSAAKFVLSWPIFTVIAIFYQQPTSFLKGGYFKRIPLISHTEPPPDSALCSFRVLLTC